MNNSQEYSSSSSDNEGGEEDDDQEVVVVEDNNSPSSLDSSLESSDVSTTMDLIEDEIRILDEEYTALGKVEQTLHNFLNQLQSEEETLRLALSQASETLIAKRARQRREREKEAISRLEAALGLDIESNADNDSK